MARKTQQRTLRQPEITIIGEGATERFYFTNLRRLKGYRYTCKPRNFTEQSLVEMQKQVDRVQNVGGCYALKLLSSHLIAV